MTKSIKKVLEHLSNQTEWCIEPERLSGVTVDRSRQQEIIDHTLKELESIIQSVIGEDENGFHSATPYRNFLREGQRRRLQTALYGEKKS